DDRRVSRFPPGATRAGRSPVAYRSSVGRWRFLVGLAVLAAIMAPSAGAHAGLLKHPGGYPGPRLTVVDGVPVYASLLAGHTPAASCPRRPLALSAGLVHAAAHAAALA